MTTRADIKAHHDRVALQDKLNQRARGATCAARAIARRRANAAIPGGKEEIQAYLDRIAGRAS